MPTTTFKTCSYCSKEVDEEELDEHRSSCGVEEVACGNGCGQKMPRYMHQQHMEESCKKRKVECHYCSAMMLFNETEDHKQQCSMEIVECQLMCGFQGERFSVSNHMTENCPRSLEACHYCTQAINKCDMDEHVAKCEDAMTSCDECGKKVPKENKEVHLKVYCSKRVKECEFCGTLVVANTMHEHYKVCDLLETHQPESSKVMNFSSEYLSENLDEVDCKSSITHNNEHDKKSKLSVHSGNMFPKVGKAEDMDVPLREKCVMNEAQCVFCDSFVPQDSLAKHYDTCELALVRCGNKCGEKKARKDLSEHYRNECPKALVGCEHCENNVERQLLEDHHAFCVKFPIPCPESCGVEVAREDMERHFDEECPKRVAACAYKEIECNYVGSPAATRQHTKEGMQHHMDLLKGFAANLHFQLENEKQINQDVNGKIENLQLQLESEKRRIQEVKRFVENLKMELENEKKRNEELQMEINVLRHGSFLWKVKDIAQKIETAKENRNFFIGSSPFYSSKHGYKLRVVLSPDGNGSQHEGHLGVYIQVMPGEYDSILKWPFTKLVKFRLVNQAMDGEDIVSSLRGEDRRSFIKPQDGKWNIAFGDMEFVSHEVLNSRSYIVDNAMFLEVSVEE